MNQQETCVKIQLDQTAPLLQHFSSHSKLHQYSRIISHLICKCKRKEILEGILKERKYFKSEEEFMGIAIHYFPLILEYASNAIKENKSIVLTAVRLDGLALEFASRKLQDDFQVALEAINQNGQALRFTHKLRSNKQLVLEAVSRCGWIIQFASEILKSDREVIKKAVEQNDDNLKSIQVLEIESNDAYDEEYLVPFKLPIKETPRKQIFFLAGCFNRNLVLETIRKAGESFTIVESQFKKDKEIVMEAVSQFPYLIQYADKSLNEDCEIALAGVSKDGRSLSYYGRAPRMDRKVALAAVLQNGRSIAYVDASLKEDYEIVKAAFSSKGRALKFTPPSVQKNRELVQFAIRNNGRAIQYASDELKEDRELVLEAVTQCGRALLFAHPKFMNDKQIIIAALSNCKSQKMRNVVSTLFHALPKRFKEDHDVVEVALNSSEGFSCHYYGLFAAFSFYNTHDFSIDDAVYYFGGIVNNTVSNRIALKTSIETILIFNQTLPYPVASGMLAIIDDYLYIFGGLTDDRGILIPTYKVMRCQLSNILIWEEFPNMLPRTIYNGVAQLIGEYVYIFGGRIGKAALNSDIIFAGASDLIWQNSHRNLPNPYTESNLFSDDSYLYMAGGFSPTYTELKGICRASKTNPLLWEDTMQILPMATMGVTSTMILNNKLYLFSVDLPQNFLKTNPNVPISLHSIYFANETKPYVAVTTSVSVTLQILDGAFIIGTVPRSCREYNDLIPTADTGVYWIKPLDTMTKFKAYCDMDLLGGGWTLVSTRSSSNPVLVPSNDYVKPDYSGNTISDDKWAALSSISTDINWMESSGYMALAPISTLSTSGTYVCKPLSTTSILEAALFRMEDTPCNYGTDTCTLGASGNSAEITSYCGKINVYNPFTFYTYPVENYGATKANMLVR